MVRILKDLEEDITGRHVLIVEDIIDTGLTLSYLRRSLLARKPASLEICALLSKPSRRQIDLDVKYVGFEVPDEFVVGTASTSPAPTATSPTSTPSEARG